MSHKKATITKVGRKYYCDTGGHIHACSTLWSACRTAVRAHREWIDSRPGGRYDNGVRIALPDGSTRMGWFWYSQGRKVVLDPIKKARKPNH